MGYHVFFSFSSGLSKAVTAPKGTLAGIMEHVAEIEATLLIKRTRYENNPEHWDTFDLEFRDNFPSVSDEVLCEVAERHNEWVRDLYVDLAKWNAQPVADGETITESDAANFWPALRMINVDPSRWTRDYYRSRMDHLYEVMRGRESEGVTLNAKRPLTSEQASAVITLFDFLDKDDLRLAVPHERDYLASSYDGGYSWCDKCYRAIGEGDENNCKRRKCPLSEEAN